MAHVRKRYPENLVCGFMYVDENIFESAFAEMEKEFGPAEMISDAWEFTVTTYYEEEMGRGIKKRIVSFADMIDPAELYKVKLFTIGLEDKFSENEKRRINIDPGTLSLGKFILASAKDYWHRIQIGGGILAEVTLRYDSEKKSFVKWECTYPDYSKPEYIFFLNKIRENYKLKIKDFEKSL